MTPSQYGLACGAFAFGIFMLGHVAILRVRNGAEPSRALMRMFAVAMIFAVVAAALIPSAWAGVLLAETFALLTLGCLFVLYGPFFYAIHTSLSVQSLVLILENGGSAPEAELARRFGSRALLKGRLDSLVAHGYLAQQADRYLVLPRARSIAKAFALLKGLWRLGPGG